MEDENAELTKWLHRQLKQLPDRQAPSTLISRTLKALEAQQRLPWWRKSFQNWPKNAQVLFIAASGAALFALLYATQSATQSVDLAQAAKSSELVAEAGSIFSSFQTFFRALSLVVTRVAGPWMALIASAILLMGASCVGLTAAFVRLAFPGISPSRP